VAINALFFNENEEMKPCINERKKEIQQMMKKK